MYLFAGSSRYTGSVVEFSHPLSETFLDRAPLCMRLFFSQEAPVMEFSHPLSETVFDRAPLCMTMFFSQEAPVRQARSWNSVIPSGRLFLIKPPCVWGCSFSVIPSRRLFLIEPPCVRGCIFSQEAPVTQDRSWNSVIPSRRLFLIESPCVWDVLFAGSSRYTGSVVEFSHPLSETAFDRAPLCMGMFFSQEAPVIQARLPFKRRSPCREELLL